MDKISIAGFVAGLLPLREKRENKLCVRPDCTLIAHRRWGMPDGRDLLALLLCSDAARKEKPRVTPNKWVSRDSLMRVATLTIERHQNQETQRIPIATRWDDQGVELSADFVGLCAESPRGQLPFDGLAGLPGGAIALAILLITSDASSLAPSLPWFFRSTAEIKGRRRTNSAKLFWRGCLHASDPGPIDSS